MMTISITFNLWPPVFVASSSRSAFDGIVPPRRSTDETLKYVDGLVARAVTRRHVPSRLKRDTGPRCPICGGPLTARQTYCGTTCRQRAHRARKYASSRQAPVGVPGSRKAQAKSRPV